MSENKLIMILLLAATMLAAGCLENGTNVSISGNDTEIEINLPETGEDIWCQAGTHIQVKNPTSNRALDMTIVGTEEFEGETLCKAVLETSGEEGGSKFEYLWSEDKNTSVWISYDSEGNVTGKLIKKEGTTTIVDGAGRVIEFRKE
ncbi:MAG: hypothetical protein PHW56_10830 [Methanosarcinaceae archaeon]|nr:hypothetical protein [Methanosarcinaceae archaeon]